MEILKIALNLVNSLSLMFVIAFLLTKTKAFKNMFFSDSNPIRHKIFLAMIFGTFGIFGTYNGFPVDGAIANSRAIAVIVAGLLGGPIAGIGAGLIAGIHRWAIDIGGFTAFACAVSTLVEGLMGSIGYKYSKKFKHKWLLGFIITVIAEIMQMAIILAIARPYSAAATLVNKIAIPMTIINSIGVALFIIMLESIYREQQREAAIQSELALKIADQTLPILRNGINRETALAACNIIYDAAKVDAVAITRGMEILAHVGAGSDHHLPGENIKTYATKVALEKGEPVIATKSGMIDCSNENCMLKSAAIAPLIKKDKVIGVLKIYKTKENAITKVDAQLAEGLAKLFSTQIELAEIDYNAKLLSKAELKALQAQINPHFLFNALNTIASVCRIDPETSRKLLINLGNFFREGFKESSDIVDITNEINHVEAYLEIEKARFGDKLKVEYDIHCDNFQLPHLTLQPLVENAVKHGIYPKREGGTIKIQTLEAADSYSIQIEDDGVGFDYPANNPKGDGIGIKNVDKRLRSIYGDDFGLRIDSRRNMGTKISIDIPKRSA